MALTFESLRMWFGLTPDEVALVRQSLEPPKEKSISALFWETLFPSSPTKHSAFWTLVERITPLIPEQFPQIEKAELLWRSKAIARFVMYHLAEGIRDLDFHTVIDFAPYGNGTTLGIPKYSEVMRFIGQERKALQAKMRLLKFEALSPLQQVIFRKAEDLLRETTSPPKKGEILSLIGLWNALRDTRMELYSS